MRTNSLPRRAVPAALLAVGLLLAWAGEARAQLTLRPFRVQAQPRVLQNIFFNKALNNAALNIAFNPYVGANAFNPNMQFLYNPFVNPLPPFLYNNFNFNTNRFLNPTALNTVFPGQFSGAPFFNSFGLTPFNLSSVFNTGFGGLGFNPSFGGLGFNPGFGGFGFNPGFGGLGLNTGFGGFGFNPYMSGFGFNPYMSGFGLNTGFGGFGFNPYMSGFGFNPYMSGFGFNPYLNGFGMNTGFGGFGFNPGYFGGFSPFGGAGAIPAFGRFGL